MNEPTPEYDAARALRAFRAGLRFGLAVGVAFVCGLLAGLQGWLR